ncbi:MAG: hypothetical protein NTU76_00075, partial [Candidatus Taylorbacteria bacterium]|nr:hypothetical protein [Candidatus Taylorbacteria bacterium]
GNSIVVEILDKAKSSTNEVYTYETGKLVSADLETYTYIILKAKVRVHMEEGKVMYGDDVSLAPGKSFGFITDNFNYNDYIISKIE